MGTFNCTHSIYLGASGETVPNDIELELADTRLSEVAELGAGWLSPKSGTVIRYWPGVS